MARPLRLEFAGAVYHVTARGNANQKVFTDKKDREIFLSYLGREIDQQRWRCLAYCLMDNHYHLVIETPEANLSVGMRRLNAVYTQAFNRRHDFAGHVLQGRYKSILIDQDNYLKEVCRHVVLNPVRTKTVRKVEKWPWSSYRVTAGEDKEPTWVDLDAVLGMFGKTKPKARKAYMAFVEEGKKAPSPWKDLRGQIFLGDDDFLATMRARLEKAGKGDAAAKRLKDRPTKTAVVRAVTGAYKMKQKDLVQRTDQSAYKIAAYLLRRAANLRLNEVADLFDVSPSRISRIQHEIEAGDFDSKSKKLLREFKIKIEV